MVHTVLCTRQLTHKTSFLRSTQILVGISPQNKEEGEALVQAAGCHTCVMHIGQNGPGLARGTSACTPISAALSTY